jgi:hypothetical protein
MQADLPDTNLQRERRQTALDNNATKVFLINKFCMFVKNKAKIKSLFRDKKIIR